MTNFSGKPLSSQTANAACGGPQGGGMDSRRNGVAEMSSTYPAEIGSKSIPVGYKQTEVGVIPDDWGVSSFDNISSLIGDGIHTTPNYDENGDFYFVNGNNLVNGSISLDGNTKKTNLTEYKKHKKPLNQRTLLLSINGTIGNVAEYNNESIVLGKSAAFINVKKGAEKKYIFYVLCSHRTNLSFFDGLTGSTIKNLGLGTIRTTLLPIPPEKEQTAIANALSDVDSLISELEKLIAKKQAIKTATMQQLLTGRTRLPQFALRDDGSLKGTKPSELGEIPEDWEVHSLSSICDVRDGTHDSPKYKDNGIPLVTSKNIVDDILDLSNVSLISPEDAFEIDKRSKVDKGDIIMSMIGTVGSAVLLLEEPKFCIKNVALFKPKKVSGEFLVQLIRSKIFQDYLEDSMDGGIQKFVSLGTLRNMEISLPSEQEQTAIATILSDMDAEIQALEQRLGKTRQIKQGMMQELLTGKTRLIKPSKEVIHE